MASSFSAVSEPMRLTRYECSLYAFDWQRRLTPKPEDIFEFNIGVVYHYSNTTMTTPLQYQNPFQYIHCQSFFEEGQHFIHALLSHPLFYAQSLLHRITNGVVTTVRRMLRPFNHSPNGSETQPQVLFRFYLVIDLFHGGDERAVMEESMQGFRMIPASKEAIQMSLKKSKVVEKNEHCTICLEEFDESGDDDDDGDGTTKSCAMPCNHVFHQQCIVSWLHTSHVCPLCRYALPTASD